MMKIMIASGGLAASVILGGCAVVTSTSYDYSKDIEVPKGFTYFLPKVMVKAKASQGAVSASTLAKLSAEVVRLDGESAAAAGTEATKKAELTTAVAAFEAASKTYREAQPEDPELVAKKKAMEDKLKEFNAAAEAFYKAAAAAAAAVSLAEAAENNLVNAQQNVGGCTVEVALTQMQVEADTSNLYVAKLDHSPFRSDELTVISNELGLLHTVDLVSDDQTAAIATAATNVFLKFQTLTKKKVDEEEAGEVEVAEAKKQEECPSKNFEIIFDPSVSSKTSGANSVAQAKGLLRQLGVALEVAADEAGKEAHTSKIVNNAAVPSSGLFYRRPIPYQFTLMYPVPKDAAAADPDWVQSERLVLPNMGPIALAPMDAGPFVKTTRTAKFINGMLVSNRAERPSELKGLIQIPAGILDALTSAE